MKEKKSEVTVIDLAKFDIQQLPELHGKKEEIKKLIKANPIVKITDNASYELAKKSRTAVKTLRTSLEKEKKEVNDRIKKSVLEVVANEYDSLITSVRNDENARQEGVTAWEEIKENERLEKLRLEQERVDNIKKSIQEFANHWNSRISILEFAQLDEFEDQLSEAFVNFDRCNLAEYEVLLDDQKTSIYAFFEAKAEQLEKSEEIRLEQIRLTEERKKQEEEAKKLTEIQRIQREEFEAEQKRVAEEQRIAQENFLREKREFEEKKNKQIQDTRLIKWTERFSNPEIRNEIMLSFSKDIEFYVSFNSSDEEFLSWVTEFGNRYDAFINQEKLAKSNESDKESVVVFEIEEVKSEKSANENYHEEDVDKKGLSTRHKANTPAIEKELTFKDVAMEYKKIGGFEVKDSAETTIALFANYLDKNFNLPTRKI